MSGKGEAKRTRKRRAARTAGEAQAFKFGAKAAREVIGPDIWHKAVMRALPIGFVVGVCTGGAIVHYFG